MTKDSLDQFSWAAVGCVFVFVFGAFALASTFLLYSSRVATPRRIAEAGSWIPTECRVLDIGFVKPERTTEPEKSHLSILYDYEFDGTTYSSNQIDLVPGRSGADADWEQELFRRLKKGSVTTCFVNPDDPADAVLDREHYESRSWLGITLLLLGILFGLGFGVHIGTRWNRV